MEAFSLLKYWRGGGGVAVSGGESGVYSRSAAAAVVTSVPRDDEETDDDENDENGDDGPFFDLEFALPDEEEDEGGKARDGAVSELGNEHENDDDAVENSDSEEDEREFNFTLSSGSNSTNNDRADPNLALSPSDENLFFKGRLVPIESNAVDSSKPQLAAASSLLKSATKFRVFLLGFKKSKTNAAATTHGTANNKANENATKEEKPTPTTNDNHHKQNKFFTVKFKVEEVPLVSKFTRENSRSVKTTASSQKHTDKSEEPGVVSVDEKQRFSKEVMHKYLKKVKPLYIRVSKRYGEKLRLSGQLSYRAEDEKGPGVAAEGAEANPTAPPVVGGGVKTVKQMNGLPAGLRVVCKHLGKSRSASSAAPAAGPPPPGTVTSRRRDDSLLQQQDGIQGAILHCKRSFNASRDSDSSR